jgi:hypothetical protein
MNKILTLIVSISFCSTSAFAYIPSVDSLFRNGNNIDVGDSTVVANIIITKINSADSAEVATEPQRSGHKFLFSSQVPGLSEFLQIDYRNVLFTPETINEVKRKKKLNLNSLSEELFETKLFYGLFKSLILNRSDLMTSFLNKIDPRVLPNKSILNKEQLALLNKYKAYLRNLNNKVEGIENPLNPISIEKRKEIKDILSKSLITDASNVKRVFENKKFYLYYKSDVLELKFENETHQLRSIKVKNGESEISIEMLNYVLFSGGFEFPEEINIKLANGDHFQVILKKLMLLKDSEQSYSKRLGRYKKQLKEVEDKIVVLNKPMFIL